jgi:hypothetical protein
LIDTGNQSSPESKESAGTLGQVAIAAIESPFVAAGDLAGTSVPAFASHGRKPTTL